MTAPTLTSITLMDIATLAPYAQNAKLHSKKQVQQIANSIRSFGFITPIIIDANHVIVAGHGRLEAAKLLKLERVPTISVTHLSEAEVRAYRLADNQLTLNTGYDDALLKIELTELSKLDLDYDLDITGFETAQIDVIIDQQAPKDDQADQVPPMAENAITKLGDLWQLGDHRLICGDSTKTEAYQTLMGDERAQMIFTDPPYAVKIDGHVCGNGKIKHREFVMGGAEMHGTGFTPFLSSFMQHSALYSVDGSLHYICMDWRHIVELITAGREHYSEVKNICVWNKSNGGMGSLYRSKHEFVAVFKHGTAPHINNIELGRHGRYRTNVWDYAGVNSFGQNQKDLEMHPTVKPVAMISDAIKDCTKRGQIVLEPFGGSGSTLIACEKTRRVARCIELDQLYCDVIIRRWQQLTGQDAVHVATGHSFNAMEAAHD